MIHATYDLHIHSCLSPCGEDEMTPSNIVAMAALKDLDIIALTDHNSCKNCPAFLELAREQGILALPGMELTTEEEVHVLCLFAELSDALHFDDYVYEHLQPVPLREDIFGKQDIMDKEENITGHVGLLLINATTIHFENVYGLMEQFHGVMVPAHIDKSSNSLLSNLGFVPGDSRFRTYELADAGKRAAITEKNPYCADCRVVVNSDAHRLEQISEPVETMEIEQMNAAAVLDFLKGIHR